MRRFRITAIGALAVLVSACGGGKNESSDSAQSAWQDRLLMQQRVTDPYDLRVAGANSAALPRASGGPTAPLVHFDPPAVPSTPSAPMTPMTPMTPLTPSSPSAPTTPATPVAPANQVAPSPPLPPSNAIVAPPVTTSTVLALKGIELAQTHVLPPQGKAWNLAGFASNQQRRLDLVGDRTALVMVRLASPLAAGESLHIVTSGSGAPWSGPLASPDTLPPTEANWPAYATDAYWTHIPAEQMRPGLSLRVVAQGGAATRSSAPQPVQVANSPVMTVRALAFYLFGTTPEKSLPESRFLNPSQQIRDEYFAKMPVTRIDYKPLPPVLWNYIVVRPSSKDAQNRGLIIWSLDDMDSPRKSEVVYGTADITGAIQSANGDKVTPTYYFAFALAADKDGNLHNGGGAGYTYANMGSGGYSFDGLFFHELGHSMGMPHATDGWNLKQYPYVKGTLAGSAWGYDTLRRRFLHTLVAPGVLPPGCSYPEPLQVDSLGRCYKNDPMQGGAQLSTPGDLFAMFSDFNAAQVQFDISGWAETRHGVRMYSGINNLSGGAEPGLAEHDPAEPSGYKRWDRDAGRYVPVPLDTEALILPTTGATTGMPRAYPIQHDVPVHTIVMTLSSDESLQPNPAQPKLTQIYPVLSYTGNLIKTIDPTSASDLADIRPDTGKYRNYCRGSGCEYTLRATYADGSRLHRLIPKGFYLPGTTTPDDAAHDPTHWASMTEYAVNLPGGKPLKRVELLSTPQAHLNGVGSNPPVIASRDVPSSP